MVCLWFFADRVPNPATFPSQLSKLFIADHPFFFYIKIKHIIIFMGRVVNPESC
jgi:serine protease inhibitor